MKNLFEINRSEKNRILEMHHGATKNMYLSKLNEESIVSPFENKMEGDKFRLWVNMNHPNWAKENSLDKTGSFNNSYIAKAWKEFGKVYMAVTGDFKYMSRLKSDKTVDKKIQKTEKNPQKKLKPDEGFVIPFAFPEYQPKIDGDGLWDKFEGWVMRQLDFESGSKEGTYGKWGHGGIATVTADGNTKLFEFGRYSGAKKGYGVVVSKNLGKIANIQGNTITNVDSLLKQIKSRTEGEGPHLGMSYAVIKAPSILKGVQYAQNLKTKEYSAADFSISNNSANCGTFALEVVQASGIQLVDACFPTPKSMINRMGDLTNVKGEV